MAASEKSLVPKSLWQWQAALLLAGIAAMSQMSRAADSTLKVLEVHRLRLGLLELY